MHRPAAVAGKTWFRLYSCAKEKLNGDRAYKLADMESAVQWRWPHPELALPDTARAKGRHFMTRQDFVRQLAMMLRDLPVGTSADLNDCMVAWWSGYSVIHLPVRSRDRRRR
jgi:hypothetical protein